MHKTAMIPLESVLKDVYLLLDDYQVEEDVVNEFAFRALEHIAVYKSYDYAVCFLEVSNNQAPFPHGMLGVDYVMYNRGLIQDNKHRNFFITDLIADANLVKWNTVEYEKHYVARITDFTALSGIRQYLGNKQWAYLNLSNNNFDKSVICNPDYSNDCNCDEWWYPDSARGRFITSFESGLIAVVYVRYPQDEEGRYLIPDMPFVKDAILNYVLSMIYLKQWLRGVQGADSKHQYFSRKWNGLANAAEAEMLKMSLPEIINTDRLNTFFKKDNVTKIVGGFGREYRNMR